MLVDEDSYKSGFANLVAEHPSWPLQLLTVSTLLFPHPGLFLMIPVQELVLLGLGLSF